MVHPLLPTVVSAWVWMLLLIPSFLTGTPEPDAPTWWKPGPGLSWQIQYSGQIDLDLPVDLYNLDLFETSAETIADLHQEERRVVCYFSAGSYEDWRPDAERFPAAAIGDPLADWDGEWWLDIRQDAVRTIMQARLDLAAANGCDGVDPDNVDGYNQETGFPINAADQIAFNTFLATEAHKRGLAIGLKNDLDQVKQLVDSFDFAVNEECFAYDECALLQPFIDQDKPVYNIEYGDSTTASSVCRDANAIDFDTLIKNLELDADRIACR